jgi:hypothetical protein
MLISDDAVLLRFQRIRRAKFTITRNSASTAMLLRVKLTHVGKFEESSVSTVRSSTSCLVALIALGSSLAMSTTAAHADRVRNACSGDYHRFCSAYSPNSSQMRACMQANGRSLSSGCVNALVDAGIIDRRQVRR